MPDSKAAAAHRRGLLVPVGAVDFSYLDYLALVLPETIGVPFRISDRALPADSAFDAVRGQWNAAKILADLAEVGEESNHTRVLGVAEFDLFIPILTFVFGLAHLGARPALVSVHRLHREFYGLPGDPELLLRRLEKEALHELGHTFGLRHCQDFACVMHYSNAVEEVDLKDARFCGTCRRSLSPP